MNNVLPDRVASEVRAEMARQKVNQTEIATALGRSAAFVSRRLSGQVPLDVAELETISNRLGVPVHTLLERAA